MKLEGKCRSCAEYLCQLMTQQYMSDEGYNGYGKCVNCKHSAHIKDNSVKAEIDADKSVAEYIEHMKWEEKLWKALAIVEQMEADDHE